MDVFQSIRQSLSRCSGEVYHLHQGRLHADPEPARELSGETPLLIAPQIHSNKGGEHALVERVAELFLGDKGEAPSIALANGGTNALWNAFRAIRRREKPVAQVLSPYWMYLDGVLRHTDHELAEISTLDGELLKSEDELLLELAQSATSKLNAVYLANPANPVGNVFTQDFVRAVIRHCERHDAYLIVDHAYYGFTDADEPTGILATLPEVYRHPRVLNCFTFSKLLGIPGLRIGFVAAAPALAARTAECYRYSNYTLNSYSQSVVYHYLRTPDLIRSRQLAYRENLAIYRRYASVGPDPRGGFFACLPERAFGSVAALLERGIGVVDGSIFGEAGRGWFRLCFTAESPARLEAALRKLAQGAPAPETAIAHVSPPSFKRGDRYGSSRSG